MKIEKLSASLTLLAASAMVALVPEMARADDGDHWNVAAGVATDFLVCD